MYSVFFLVVIMVLLCEIRVHGQTPQSNQGSQGRQRAKPGFRQQRTIENRGQREQTGSGDPQTRDEGSQVLKRGKQGFPGLAKRQTRVPRGRKEANKGSQRSKRGKQGFTGSGAAQTRVFSAKKPQNRVPSTAKY